MPDHDSLDPKEVVLKREGPCRDGICQERLCGRMKQELRFFTFLAEAELSEVAGYFECRQLPPGAILWREGEAGDFIAFVISGRLEISKKAEFGPTPIVVGILSRGAMVGELSALEGSRRSETAAVLDHVELILLYRQELHRLLKEQPALGNRLLEGMLITVSRRLKHAYERLSAIF